MTPRSMVGWLGGVVLAVVLSGAGTPAPLGAQTIQAGGLELDLLGQVQIQLNSTSVDGADVEVAPASTGFETRRMRLGTTFSYNEWITGEVKAEFAGGSARLADGYVDLALAGVDGPFSVRAGQFKKPFGVFELESSSKIRTIERGVRIRGLTDLVAVPAETQWLLDEGGYLGRQIGVMAHGALGAVGWAAGVFNGEGTNVRETEGSKAVAGRLTVELLESLVLGAGVSVQPTGRFEAGGEDEIHGTAVELDASWGGFRREGLHVRAEWMTGDNPALAVAGDLPTMTGVHGLVSWFAPRTGRVEGVEPVLRLSWADPDTDFEGDEGLLLTPGVNLYFDGRNRFMVNGDVYSPGQEGLDPEFALVAQIQVHF